MQNKFRCIGAIALHEYTRSQKGMQLLRCSSNVVTLACEAIAGFLFEIGCHDGE